LPNTGDRDVDAGTVTLLGGTQTLTAADANTLETEGIYTALIRLSNAIENNDTWEIQRAIDVLDRKTVDMNFSRAELGARQQSLDVLNKRLEDEDVELKSILSEEYDADLVEVISNLTSRQAAFEASLRTMGSIFQMSLLNYL